MSKIKNFQCLTDTEREMVHKTRLAMNYKYRKAICKGLNMYMSLDETFYYNKFIYLSPSINS